MWRSSLVFAVSLLFASPVWAATTFDYNPLTGKLDLILDNSNMGVVTGTTATFTGYNCTTYASGGTLTTDAAGNLQCQDDDTGAGGGDAITVNGSAATDANFADSATIAWTLTTALSPDQVSGIVVANSIGLPQLGNSDFGDFTCDDTSCLVDSNAVALTTDTTGNYVATVSCNSTVSGCVADAEGSAQLVGVAGSSLTRVHFNSLDTPADEESLTYESSTGQFEWQAGGTDTNAVKEYWWPCAAALPLEAADSIPPLSKDAGTNLDQLNCAFDDGTDEGRTVVFKVPSDIDSTATVTFRAYSYSAAATTGDFILDFRHNSGVADGVDPDAALTTEAAAADTTAGTAGQVNVTSWTETVSNLGWVANDLVYGVLYRDANAAGDTLVGDLLLIGFSVEIPRA